MAQASQAGATRPGCVIACHMSGRVRHEALYACAIGYLRFPGGGGEDNIEKNMVMITKPIKDSTTHIITSANLIFLRLPAAPHR